MINKVVNPHGRQNLGLFAVATIQTLTLLCIGEKMMRSLILLKLSGCAAWCSA
jgi:hypothetical protein